MPSRSRSLEDAEITQVVRCWVETVVVGLNLCPFAQRELVNDRVRFAVTEADSEDQLSAALQSELERLQSDPRIETTLLIHPLALQDFDHYNQFLDRADRLLLHLHLDGVYQVASFHPEYQFAGTAADDAENYTNRSPYPMLHLIREDSLERAIHAFAGVEDIPASNIRRMNELGQEKLRALVQACFSR
ncbi:MAG: DUF1415 domain-containing protein [Pseudomonadales bacterium]